jgi:phenylacetate-CoA ligase
MGKDTHASPLRLGVFGGEPGAGIPEVKRTMEEGWGFKAIDFGNSAEVHPPSNMECEHRVGMHVYNDVVHTEVVNKDDPHAPVPMGERGGIVYTALWRRSQPMIRYWVGDEAVMIDEPCPCGRTYPRLPHGVLGRLDDLLIIRGANVYPSAIESALRDVPGIGVEFRVYVTKKAGSIVTARIDAEVDPARGVGPGGDAAAQALRKAAENRIKAVTGITIPVTLVAAGTFSRASLKARRVTEVQQ